MTKLKTPDEVDIAFDNPSLDVRLTFIELIVGIIYKDIYGVPLEQVRQKAFEDTKAQVKAELEKEENGEASTEGHH